MRVGPVGSARFAIHEIRAKHGWKPIFQAPIHVFMPFYGREDTRPLPLSPLSEVLAAELEFWLFTKNVEFSIENVGFGNFFASAIGFFDTFVDTIKQDVIWKVLKNE